MTSISTLIIAAILGPTLLGAATPNLVPETPSTVPDYFCTWSVQGHVTSYQNALLQADAMMEANLFGQGPKQNWTDFYAGIRGDLFFVLDDTWDIPIGGGRSHPMRGSMELDEQRFPSYRGKPAVRLAQLNEDVRARGWRGAGLWICSARAKARRDPAINDHDYWAERMQWSQQAGIEYWKVDWGAMSAIDVWRLNRWSRELVPTLWIEHGSQSREGDRMWLPDKIDIFRTYDVNVRVSIPETIRRIAQVLRFPRQDTTTRALINCEDEVYIGAALGCLYGVMRHPLVGNMPNGEDDPFFPVSFRNMRRRIDEVTRAVRWHRIAQPFPVGAVERIDSNQFFDGNPGVGVPARVARGGLPLPDVSVPAGEEAPYVLCSRYPDGEIAVATVGRKQGTNVVLPKAHVVIDAGSLNRPVGIFGDYASLTLVTTATLAGRRILAQDLAGESSVDITREVTMAGNRLTIPGAVIRRVGLMAASAGDISDPGLVLAIEQVANLAPKPAMTPASDPPRGLASATAGPGLTITRALWGPVHGGRDVTADVAARVKDGALEVDATVEMLGSEGISGRFNRLEIDFTHNGKPGLVLGVLGERVRIDRSGRHRTERAPVAKPPATKAP